MKKHHIILIAFIILGSTFFALEKTKITCIVQKCEAGNNERLAEEKDYSARADQGLGWEKFLELESHKNTVVIDIRTQEEIVEGKLFRDAREIDFYKDDFEQNLDKLSKDKIYLIYCRSGNRSSQALEIFNQKGLSTYHLQDGYNGVNKKTS